MKITLYLRYATRSLWRGGGRTGLAVVCVTVGVMALVALQLIGLMANNALTSNIRAANGGDLAVSSATGSFTAPDLRFFSCLRAGIAPAERASCAAAHLKANGEILEYTASVGSGATAYPPDGRTVLVGLQAVNTRSDPIAGAPYPLVGSPALLQPPGADFQRLLATGPNNAVVTKSLFDALGEPLGATVRVATVGSAVFRVTIAGVLANEGAYAQGTPLMVMPRSTLRAVAPDQAGLYNTVDLTTSNAARTNQVRTDVQAHFPVATLTTAEDLLQQNKQQVDYVRKFLQIVGLMALLIGGVGIANTMQVLLRRRRIEIAMLKTTGYRRRDLYLLFGLEAGLLGLVGGVLGASAAVGLGLGLKSLAEAALSLSLPFVLDWPIVGSGVLIGVVTALIFGLLPIVRATAVRPQTVLREIEEWRGWGSRWMTAGLLCLLCFVFFLVATAIMGDLIWSAGVVFGGAFLMGVLSLLFTGIVWLISALPVPERATTTYLLLVTMAVAATVALTVASPGFGLLALMGALLGYAQLLFPRSWKAMVKLCLHNIGRQRNRTVATLLALFVGVFSVSSVLVLGQDISDKLQNGIANSVPYNVIARVPPDQQAGIDAALITLPGLVHGGADQPLLVNTADQLTPVCVGDKPVSSFITPASGTNALDQLSSVQGYDLARYPGGVPNVTMATGTAAGRMLTAADAGTNAVLARSILRNAPLHLRVGSTVTLFNALGAGPGASGAGSVACGTLAQRRGQQGLTTVTIAGFYNQPFLTLDLVGLYGSDRLVRVIGGRQTEITYYLKVASNQTGTAVRLLGLAAPKAYIINTSDFAVFINQLLSKVVTALTAVAGLTLLAGIVIIANAVALAMLERRREVGILKSVGYTSRTVLGQVLLENCLIGGLGAFLAMALVTVLIAVAGRVVFQTSLEVGIPITFLVILGTMALAMTVAGLVAWRAVRVRPVEVLRYE
jgi:predicted lysophospholipase L1 biosynthesis ABC-type transport system permease subunit